MYHRVPGSRWRDGSSGRPLHRCPPTGRGEFSSTFATRWRAEIDALRLPPSRPWRLRQRSPIGRCRFCRGTVDVPSPDAPTAAVRVALTRQWRSQLSTSLIRHLCTGSANSGTAGNFGATGAEARRGRSRLWTTAPAGRPPRWGSPRRRRSAALGAAVLNERVAAGAEASKGLTKRTDGEPEVQRACRMAR